MQIGRIALSHAELKENSSYRKNVPLVNLFCKGVTEQRQIEKPFA